MKIGRGTLRERVALATLQTTGVILQIVASLVAGTTGTTGTGKGTTGTGTTGTTRVVVQIVVSSC